LVVALWPLMRLARVQRVVVSTYQAVSGSGARGLDELARQIEDERAGRPLVPQVYPAPIASNVIPFVQAFAEDGLTTEEWKMIRETRRICSAPDLSISATCVRVPVRRAHSESVNVEFDREVTPEEVRTRLASAPGVR